MGQGRPGQEGRQGLPLPRARVSLAPKYRIPKQLRGTMSTCVFIQIRCKPGTTYKVAEEIALREIHSELYSTSGDFDLLMKLYIPSNEDVGKYINDQLLDIEGIERSLTTMTFKVF
jgi:DNA-binding Lrp family transcriptional regulator